MLCNAMHKVCNAIHFIAYWFGGLKLFNKHFLKTFLEKEL